ncbi:MAG TPA: glutamate--cysteine ligase, partial [Gammaproteobacteria bacterium]|nr:glutamate--cysteine ligase [Gammaproteobacteria bacterium]
MRIEHLHPVPHLTTALRGPLEHIESHLLACQADIEAWFRQQWLTTTAPFYASVDLRNAGFKLAPVDTNLFPAGFNNLSADLLPLCIQAIQSAFERTCPEARQVLLIPENHTRNTYYLESLATLQDIIRKAGYTVRICSLIESLTTPEAIDLPSGRSILLEPIQRRGDRLVLDDFDPCMILLNNDLSSGRPAILEGLEQTIVPPLELGWANRLKSDHFARYQEVTREFAALIDIDPWLITPQFLKCGEINFMKRSGEECLAQNVSALLESIQRKYDQYGLDHRPFVVIKADAGTYGMGVMTVHSADEVRALNRKQRTRMAASKGGMETTRVILQEGVYTFETWGDSQAVTEPVVYMIDHFVVG